MKTETKIADTNIFNWNTKSELVKPDRARCNEHLSSCQRFLGFLESLRFIFTPPCPSCKNSYDTQTKVDLERHDLKNAIKIYSDAGIK